MESAGVPQGSCTITDQGMTRLIDAYCREAGVRNLKKQLEKIYRKVALKLVRQKQAGGGGGGGGEGKDAQVELRHNIHNGAKKGSQEGTVGSINGAHDDALEPPPPLSEQPPQTPVAVVDAETLAEYVGQPPFTNDRLYTTTPPGVVMGLAWTAMGGTTLYIEAAAVASAQPTPQGGAPAPAPPSKAGSMRTTGQLGDVMKESASIAYTYARQLLQEIAPGNTFLDTADVHVHVPAGATPKDGPSAGCTIVTALLSLALRRPVKTDFAMTGEVTLTGRVLPVGGIKEKLLAAKRAGVKEVVFPAGNRAEYSELSDNVKEGVTAHFVEQYREVYDVALEDA